jgi:hypothetical protein
VILSNVIIGNAHDYEDITQTSTIVFLIAYILKILYKPSLIYLILDTYFVDAEPSQKQNELK